MMRQPSRGKRRFPVFCETSGIVFRRSSFVVSGTRNVYWDPRGTRIWSQSKRTVCTLPAGVTASRAAFSQGMRPTRFSDSTHNRIGIPRCTGSSTRLTGAVLGVEGVRDLGDAGTP